MERRNVFDAQMIEELRSRLLTEGSAKITDGRGRRLYLVHSRLLKEDFDGIMVAYEGNGAFVFELDRPVNKFRLINSGFDMAVAEVVADLINRMVEGGVAPSISAPKRRPRAIAHSKQPKE